MAEIATIPEKQFGFSASLNTEYQLLRVIDAIEAELGEEVDDRDRLSRHD